MSNLIWALCQKLTQFSLPLTVSWPTKSIPPASKTRKKGTTISVLIRGINRGGRKKERNPWFEVIGLGSQVCATSSSRYSSKSFMMKGFSLIVRKTHEIQQMNSSLEKWKDPHIYMCHSILSSFPHIFFSILYIYI